MFGKRCSLCGGKLDSNMVCRECGLDNSKSEKYYKINVSNCDDMPLTHVHEEAGGVKRADGYRQAERPVRPRASARPNEPRKERSARRERAGHIAPGTASAASGENAAQGRAPHIGRRIVFVIVLFMAVNILVRFIHFAADYVTDRFSQSGGSYDDYEIDPYEELTEKLPAFGEKASYTLSNGEYVVGVHIPAGNYKAETSNDYDVVEVQDYAHNIYMYEYEGLERKTYLDDLRLFDGAVVRIDAEEPVEFSTENAQTGAGAMRGTENPLTESVELSVSGQDTLTAGEDFAPGVYDLVAAEGSGEIDMAVYGEDGEEYTHNYWYVYENEGFSYRNLVLPRGAQFTVSADSEDIPLTFRLVPAAVIESEDYMAHYQSWY